MVSAQLVCAAVLFSSAIATRNPEIISRRDSTLFNAIRERAANNNNNNNNKSNNESNNKSNNAAAQAAPAGATQSQGQSKQGDKNRGNQSGQASNVDQNGADSTTLSPDALQSGSFFDGQQAIGAEDTQAPSLTSKNNFINGCAGKTLTDGLQIVEGSCNGIIMGELPAKARMVSSIILFPQNGQSIPAGQDFNITVQMSNIQAGTFTNPVSTYYSAPQKLNGQGIIIGHTHVTVQDLGKSLNPQVPPDPTQFAFFKGINDAGNGKGLLQATVAGGLPAGNFRVCTMAAATNHQPVIMPVAQRGSQDDCTKFTVSSNGGAVNVAANNGSRDRKASS